MRKNELVESIMDRSCIYNIRVFSGSAHVLRKQEGW